MFISSVIAAMGRPFGQLLADPPVATQRADARRHQVPHAGQGPAKVS